MTAPGTATAGPDGYRRLLGDHFAAKQARDQERLASQLTTDVRWWAPKSAARLGLARPVEGREAVVALLMTLGLYVPDRRRWSLHHVLVDGETGAVHGTLETETVAGQRYQNHYVFVFEFREGLIHQVWEHLDTAYLYERLDVAGPGG